MSVYLDTRGNNPLAVACCARCGEKFPWPELKPDPNAPGLYCCPADLDQLDPYRLPARSADQISLAWARPDRSLDANPPTAIYANQINGISNELPNVPWAAITFFTKGQLSTPINPNDTNNQLRPSQWASANDKPLPIYQFLALNGGITGATAPNWPTNAGVEIVDGAVTWLCVGILLM